MLTSFLQTPLVMWRFAFGELDRAAPPVAAATLISHVRFNSWISQLRRVWPLVSMNRRRLIVLLAVAAMATAWLPVGIGIITKSIIDRVLEARRSLPDPDGTSGDRGVYALIACEMGIVLALILAERGMQALRQKQSGESSVEINARLLKKAAGLRIETLENGDVMDRIVHARREGVLSPPALLSDLLTTGAYTIAFVGYAIILYHFSIWIVGAMLTATGVPILLNSAIAKKVPRRRSETAKRLVYLSHLLISPKHLKEIKVYGAVDELLQRFVRLAYEDMAPAQTASVRRGWVAFGASAFSVVVFYCCYGIIATSAMRGTCTVGALTLYFISLRRSRKALDIIVYAVTRIGERWGEVANLLSVLEYREPVLAPAASRARSAERGIRFEDVSFRYPGSDRWAVRGVSFFVPEGQAIAIVGENGAGKSTLIKLLARLYAPTEGHIFIDGRDIVTLNGSELLRRLSVVFQDFNRYELSVRDNVVMGDLARRNDTDAVEQALEASGALEFVNKLPAGMETLLGRSSEDGTDLSGGQWQRLALARAFFRTEADLLILDEATSGLDSKAEQALGDRLALLTRGRTTILITHRFQTARMVDSIAVMERGRLVELGTHDQLVLSSGTYFRLFSLQAATFR